MAVLDIFSKRQLRLRGEMPEVFVYDKISEVLRAQLIHVLRDYLGDASDVAQEEMVAGAYKFIVEALCREYGLFRLLDAPQYGTRNYIAELFNFILNEKNTERVLDAVELCCQVIDDYSRKWEYRHRHGANEQADAALLEINTRFRHEGFGYRFEAGELIRVDSEIVHSEVVKPALVLLHDRKYRGAEAEFHLAFEHYRHARTKEALAECLKSLESCMKAIASHRKWDFDPKATAKPLINLMFEKQLIPELWAQHFSGLRGMLESGVPTARNRLGGHGQGTEIVTVPPHVVAFALHQTAAAIVFLAQAEAAL